MDDIQEILDRCRRIETRLTRYLESQGIDSGGLKPQFKGGRISIPNMNCSLLDCLNSIPDNWDKHEEVIIIHRGEFVAKILPINRED